MAWISAQDRLTEDRAVALAIEQDLRLTALRHEIRAAELAPKGVGLLASPQIRIGVRDIAPDLNDPGFTRTNAGLAWTPPKIGTFSHAARVAETRARETSAQWAARKARTEAETRVLYRTAVLLDEQRQLAARAIELRERVLAAVSQQVAAGLKTRLDRDAAELALAEARVQAEQVRSERLTHLVRLGNRTGLAPASIAIAPSEAALLFRAPAFDREELRRQALTARPELRGADARCRLLELSLAESRRDLYPWFSSVQLFRRTTQLSGAQDWGYQVSADVPVFRWKENSMPAARQQLEACRASRRAAEAEITAEVDELVARLASVSSEIEQHRRTMIDLGSKQVESARSMLASRETDLVEPLLAELRLTGLRQSYVSRLMEFRALEAGLGQALGN